MIYRANMHFSHSLLSLPESGMGYQIISANRSGSYTTTEEDYLLCKNNDDDPIDRYALPNNESIKWVFYIRPDSNDQYRPGIVQPANNHSGGGEEALFDQGTSNETYIERKSY